MYTPKMIYEVSKNVQAIIDTNALRKGLLLTVSLSNLRDCTFFQTHLSTSFLIWMLELSHLVLGYSILSMGQSLIIRRWTSFKVIGLEAICKLQKYLSVQL